MELANGDMNRISRLHFTHLITDLHTTQPFLYDVDLFHGVRMAKKFISRRD